jgi:hypothetical protein
MNEKAVAIAEDVIAHCNTLNLTTGKYFHLNVNFWEQNPSEGDLKDYVEEIQPFCSVCALGAGIWSKARLFDNVPMEYFVDKLLGTCNGNGMVDTLEDVFSHKSIVLIEAAFERTRPLTDYIKNLKERPSEEELWDAVNFGHLYKTNAERLCAIYQNVVDNDGEFIPPANQKGV